MHTHCNFLVVVLIAKKNVETHTRPSSLRKNNQHTHNKKEIIERAQKSN